MILHPSGGLIVGVAGTGSRRRKNGQKKGKKDESSLWLDIVMITDLNHRGIAHEWILDYHYFRHYPILLLTKYMSASCLLKKEPYTREIAFRQIWIEYMLNMWFLSNFIDVFTGH